MKESKIKRILRHFDGLLAIDKSIDFVLIFVGLLAALALENRIEKTRLDQEYISLLSRIHTEVLVNQPKIETYNKTVLAYFDLLQDQQEKVQDGHQESIAGNSTIFKNRPDPIQTSVYSAIHRDEFQNGALLSEIIHLYELYERLETEARDNEISMFDMADAYSMSYGRVAYGYDIEIDDFVEWNLSKLRVQQNLVNVQESASNAHVSADRIAIAIENELSKFQVGIMDVRTPADYYWLSMANLYVDAEESMRLADLGIYKVNSLITDKYSINYKESLSIFGRLHNVKLWLIRYKAVGESDYWNFPNHCAEFEELLDRMEFSGIYPVSHFEYKGYYLSSSNKCDELNTHVMSKLDMAWDESEMLSLVKDLPYWVSCLTKQSQEHVTSHPHVPANAFEKPKELL